MDKELSGMRHKLAAVEKECNQLKAQLQALHQSQFKARKEPTPPVDASESRPAPKKRGAPKGHPAWQRRKPTHVDLVIPVGLPGSCPLCQGTQLTPTGQVHEHLQEDILMEPRVVVTSFVHQQAHCATCDCIVHACGPGEMPGSYIGPAAKAAAVYLRYQLNVPVRKISQFFADFFGLKFVPASAFGFERQAVRRGLPLYQDLLKKVRSLALAHADETSWRNDGNNFWVWFAGNQDLAAFRLDAHRSTEAAQELLGENFGGILVADAYASYNGVHPKGRQSCLAHIKTKARELGKELALLKGRALDPAARRFCQQVQGFVRDACRAHRQLAQGKWRAGRAKSKEKLLREQLKKICRHSLRHERTESFRQRLLGKEQNLLFTCFGHPGVPPTNNLAERSLRPVVIMRRVIQGTRSQKGMENHSVLRSLFETARRQGKMPHHFFFNLFTLPTAQAQASLYRKALDTHPSEILRC
jgi:hypothetical protein